MAPLTSPLAEAMEKIENAARAWIDGPLVAARHAAAAAEGPEYSAQQAAANIATWWVHCAKASGITAIEIGEAVAILALPPVPYELHRCPLPDGVEPGPGLTVKVIPDSLVWKSPKAFPAPDPLPTASIVAAPSQPADPSVVWVRLAPATAPKTTNFTLDLAIARPGFDPTVYTVDLDVTTLEI